MLGKSHAQEKEARTPLRLPGAPEHGPGQLSHMCAFPGPGVLSLVSSFHCSMFSSLSQPPSLSYLWFLLPHAISTYTASAGCFPHSTWHLHLCLTFKDSVVFLGEGSCPTHFTFGTRSQGPGCWPHWLACLLGYLPLVPSAAALGTKQAQNMAAIRHRTELNVFNKYRFLSKRV